SPSPPFGTASVIKKDGITSIAVTAAKPIKGQINLVRQAEPFELLVFITLLISTRLLRAGRPQKVRADKKAPFIKGLPLKGRKNTGFDSR
ncbi:hypothetical protein OFC37_26065, partial [Escherichia coli]|nr:hypothetical protein [Escherichia coli]